MSVALVQLVPALESDLEKLRSMKSGKIIGIVAAQSKESH